jgi:hypothetical protein
MKLLQTLIEEKADATDPIRRMAGADDFEPEPVDSVVYR